jgi:hypothetical protein
MCGNFSFEKRAAAAENIDQVFKVLHFSFLPSCQPIFLPAHTVTRSKFIAQAFSPSPSASRHDLVHSAALPAKRRAAFTPLADSDTKVLPRDPDRLASAPGGSSCRQGAGAAGSKRAEGQDLTMRF